MSDNEELITIPKAEYDLLKAKSEKYDIHIKITNKYVPICYHKSEIKCGNQNCQATKIGSTFTVSSDDYFIGCKTMRKCSNCNFMFCEKHLWYYMYKKATHGYYDYECGESCETCLPKYIADGFVNCTKDEYEEEL
jgi:hypothetical protein